MSIIENTVQAGHFMIRCIFNMETIQNKIRFRVYTTAE